MFLGSCTQQPDRPNNWEKRGDDQEDHGGHGHQDHGQLHQRHLLLQPWTCDHHQGSNTRHFQSWSRGDFRNKSEKIVHLLILRSLQSYGLLTRLIYRFFTISITVSNVIILWPLMILLLLFRQWLPSLWCFPAFTQLPWWQRSISTSPSSS